MITLTSDVYVVTEIKRKTRAKVFEDWRVGDRIRFSTQMKAVGGASGGGIYASMFTVTNLTQGTAVTKSQTEMSGMFGDSGCRFGVFVIEPEVIME